jgi:hypothetical protein
MIQSEEGAMATPRLTRSDIVQIRIALLQVEPEVWRRVLVPATLPLHRLHATIQAAMGWLDQHLYEFRADARRYGELDPDLGSAVIAARTVKFSGLLEKGVDRLLYTYDLGDDWRHEIVVEDIRPGEPGVTSSNAQHSLEQRLAHLILMIQDRVSDDKVCITQQIIGKLLGVRRASVTSSLKHFVSDNSLATHRGHIEVLSREKLEQRACGCYGISRHTRSRPQGVEGSTVQGDRPRERRRGAERGGVKSAIR